MILLGSATQNTTHMSAWTYELALRDYIGTTIGESKGDTRSLDYSSHEAVYGSLNNYKWS